MRSLVRFAAWIPATRHRQHVALRHLTPGDQRGRLGGHQHPPTGGGPAGGDLLLGDVNHAGSPQRVEMGQRLFDHGGEDTQPVRVVYQAVTRRSDSSIDSAG